MNPKELQAAYVTFFQESEAGSHFFKQLDLLINRNHEEAENNPDAARDYMQRAKGLREVIAHINSTTAGVKKIKVK